MSEHGRHLPQYFTLFVMYASLGAAEKTQLLRLGVPATFIQVQMLKDLGSLYKGIFDLLDQIS